ncbi:MAG TPA: SGNH/GDSL hydrolase family protein [Chloroflexota bacterium]|nr:SGNH/GDSL hydrolase family protein [Chloroflexota bacterium]
MSGSANYLITPPGWDDGYQAAKANAGTAPMNIAVFGDSIAAGVNSSNAVAFPEQIQRLLVARHGLWGDYWPGVFGWSQAVNGRGWSGAQNGATLTTYSGEGYGPWWYSSSTASNASQTFTTPYACTAFDILYWDSFAANGSTWQYSLDGGATVTVTNTASSTIKRISFSGLALGIHTFAWGWQSANATAAIMGAATYAGSGGAGTGGTGVATIRYGASGTALYDFRANPTTLQAARNPHQAAADLAILELVTNDINGNNALATVEQSLYEICKALRADNPNCSFLFVIPSYPDTTLDDCKHAFANSRTAYQWHDVLYRAALRFDGALADIHRKWGGQGHALGFQSSSDLHPLTAGQNDIAGLLLPLF